MELEAWQEELIEGCRVAHMATIARDGRPALVPVCFARVGGTFVVPIDEKPKSGRRLARLRNIERDARIGLLFDRYDEDWRRLAWLRIDGEAAIVERGHDEGEALAALRERYAQYRGMALEQRPLIVMTARRLVSWRWPAG